VSGDLRPSTQDPGSYRGRRGRTDVTASWTNADSSVRLWISLPVLQHVRPARGIEQNLDGWVGDLCHPVDLLLPAVRHRPFHQGRLSSVPQLWNQARVTTRRRGSSMKIACPFCRITGDIPDGSTLRPLKCRQCGTRFHPRPPPIDRNIGISSPDVDSYDEVIEVDTSTPPPPIDLGITTDEGHNVYRANVPPAVVRPVKRGVSLQRIYSLFCITGMATGLAILAYLNAEWLSIDFTSVPFVREIIPSKEQEAIERYIHIIPMFNPDTDKIIRWYPAQ
jgi:hypothetical protein